MVGTLAGADRVRCYSRLLLRAQGQLALARMRLARAEFFTAWVGGAGASSDVCVCHHLAEVRRWERVRAWLVRRRLWARYGV